MAAQKSPGRISLSRKPLDCRAGPSGTGLAKQSRMTRRLTRRLGLDRLDWRTCWKSLDFWLAIASVLLPFGFLLLLLPRHPLRVTLRRSRT